jgi:hypothetical protein
MHCETAGTGCWLSPSDCALGGIGWLAQAETAMVTTRSGNGFISSPSSWISRFRARRRVNLYVIAAGSFAALRVRTTRLKLERSGKPADLTLPSTGLLTLSWQSPNESTSGKE